MVCKIAKIVYYTEKVQDFFRIFLNAILKWKIVLINSILSEVTPGSG